MSPSVDRPNSDQRRGQNAIQDQELGAAEAMQHGEKPVSYWVLLANPQMAVLCFLRIAGQLGTLSLLSYLPFQLRYLSPTASDEDLAFHAGLLIGAKTLAKVCTGVLWGIVSDTHGRKNVLLIGLIGSAAANAGYGFSTSFSTAIVWQIVQGVASNEIALTRTISAELYLDASSTDRSRAVLLPLLVSGIGMILGPVLGGFSSDLKGLGAFSSHPYALPNVIVAIWYAVSAILVSLFVQETLRTKHTGANLAGSGTTKYLRKLLGRLHRDRETTAYREVPQAESIPLSTHQEDDEPPTTIGDMPSQRKPHLRQTWTAEVGAVMTAHFIITGHISTFGTVYTIFLSTPIDGVTQHSTEENGSSLIRRTPSPFLIRGGLGLTSPQIGTFLTSATVLFALLQGLVFPRLVRRVGTVRLWRLVLLVFPVIYFLAPLPNLLTSDSHPSILSWTSIAIIMVVFMTAQALAMPPMVIFISECVPHPEVRGLVNAIGTTVGNLARTVFPVLVMFVYGIGLKHGMLVGAFWLLSGMAGVAIVSSRWVGSGLDETAHLKRNVDAVD